MGLDESAGERALSRPRGTGNADEARPRAVLLGAVRATLGSLERRTVDGAPLPAPRLERWRTAQRKALGITKSETLPELSEEQINEVKSKHKASR